MALLKWGEDEEEQKDDLLGAPAIKTVASVQSGWQPTQDDTIASTDEPQSENYLMSDQKAQVDQQLQQRKAAEAAAAAEAARQEQAARQADANARANAAEEAQVVAPQTKYGGGEKKNEGGIGGFFKDVGAGIQQGIGALGDIAIQGGGVIGSIGKNGQELAKHVQEVEKVRGWLHSQKDVNNNSFVGTRDVEQNAADINAGRGDLQDFMAIGGKGLQAGIDATMLLNPARMAVKGMPVVNSATLASRVASSPAVRYAARDAAFYGGLQGAATGADVYGETGDLGQALQGGAQDAIVGGALQGTLDLAGHTVRKAYEPFIPVANKTINSLRAGERVPAVEDGMLLPAVRPAPVEDGIVTTTPNQLQDSNISFETPQTADMSQIPNEVTPITDTYTPAAPVVEDGVSQIPEQVMPADVLPEQSPIDNVNLDNIVPAVDAPAQTGQVAPVADGVVLPSQVMPAAATPNMPVIKGEEVRALQEARAGTNQADEAVINQRLQEVNENIPRIDDSVPETMETPLSNRLTPAKVAERLMPKLADNSDMKARIANAVDMGKDTQSPISDILRDGGVNPARAERITKLYSDLEKHLQDYNAPQAENQRAYAEGGTAALDSDVSRARSRVTRDMGITTRRLVREIDRLEGSRDKKVALVNNVADLIGTRNANVLSSAGLLERNVTQELTAGAKLALKNPIKMAKSTFNNGNIIADTAKGELSRWKDAPTLNPIDIVKYVVGNTYRTGMIPTTTLANTRKGMYRDELTKWAYETLEGRSISSKEAHKLAGTAGNEMEALVNTLTGVDNGMTNRGDAMAALKSWKEYIKTGDDGAKSEFLKRVETHSNLADQMIAGLSKDDTTKGRGLKAMANLIFPFVRTATNLMRTTVKQDLNPAAKSLVDEIRSDLRSKPENAALILKSKLVDYGIMSGAVALASAGVIAYNNGDEVDKPRGWSINIGDDKFIPIRSTAMELPIALAATGQQIVQDIQDGKTREPSHYTGMVTGSLPYIDAFNQTTGAVDSAMNGEDGGYAATSYGVNMAKSFVPGTNNGVEAYVDGKQGNSTNAKTVYDKDPLTWFTNAVQSAWSPEFRDGLNDSRDAAGRTRTVDNQGAITNKRINDANSATHNDTIDDLVKYGRENGLGKGTQDMFNTYDTGKNNNFKSIQDAITFLDVVEGADGKKSPQNEKKLENNEKLGDLAAQIRDGFYGDTGSELLTLDGKDLYSDVSVPNKNGTKNSKLPMNMQSIKNAIAQTDLPEDQRDEMYAISQANDDLYAKLKEKSISYDQYSAAKAENEKTYISILSNSENYKKLGSLMDTLDDNGFFEVGGIGSTKSGQTYLWNSLNALLGSKGATPAANYPDSSKGFTPYGRGGRGSGRGATNKPGDRGNEGIKWTPVKARQMASVASGKYTPVNIKVKLGNAVKKNKTQNYSDRSF